MRVSVTLSAIFFLIWFFWTNLHAQSMKAIDVSKDSSSYHVVVDSAFYLYEVNAGESLSRISRKFTNDLNRWDELLKFNQRKIYDPDLIYPGQQLLIPPAYLQSENYASKKLVNSLRLYEGDLALYFDSELHAVKNQEKMTHSASADSLKTLQALRSIFEKAKKLENIQEKKKKDASTTKAQTQQKPINATSALEIDGLILDETRSKIGKDFFDTFYQSWVKPKDTYGFTIRIVEKPVPGLGSLLEVMVNGTIAFQSRLQPRADLIEQSGKQAVLYARYYLKNQPTLRVF